MVSVIVILFTRQVSGQTARMTRRATHASRLMLVGGRASVASGMLIQPVSEGHVEPVGHCVSVRPARRGQVAWYK